MAKLRLVRRGFWDGPWGIALSFSTAALVVAMLVAWVLVWVARGGTPSIVFLVLGSVGFTAVLFLVFTLLFRLRRQARLREEERLFLVGASHGLRTPLAGLQTALQAMEMQGVSKEDQVRLWQIMKDESRRLSVRIDNLLEMSRFEIEHRAFSLKPLNLSEHLKKWVENTTPHAADSSAIELDQPDDITVLGEKRSLRLLFENLLENAWKFSDSNPKLRVGVRREANWVSVRIEDNGMGFDDPDSEVFFHRFRQGDHGKKGAGLGLALVRAITTGHGGRVQLTSAGSGKGAIVTVWLRVVSKSRDTIQDKPEG
jgi:two-component system sensor histidine kinase SenX3